MQKNIAILVQKMYETGVARVAANLSTYLSDDRYNKNIFTYDAKNIGYSFKGEIIDLKTTESNKLPVKLWNLLKRVYLTKKAKRKKKIDVTISFQLSAGLINILTRNNDKVIISIRSFILKDSSSGLYRYLYKNIIKLVFNKADLIVPVSKAIEKDLIDNFGIHKQKVKVINNFYDIDYINDLANEAIENKYKRLFNNPVLITAGRLTEQKGHWHLIRAFKQVKAKIPDAKLVILGQGTLEGYLRNLARELGIDKDVYFLGFQKNPFKYISRSDIYAFPSLYEGFPNALSEAMACGLPVISADCESGPREILSPGLSIDQSVIKEITYADYGILVPTCDGRFYEANESLSYEESCLADAIIGLFKDQGSLDQYKELSKQRIEDFSKDNIIQNWEAAINS